MAQDMGGPGALRHRHVEPQPGPGTELSVPVSMLLLFTLPASSCVESKELKNTELNGWKLQVRAAVTHEPECHGDLDGRRGPGTSGHVMEMETMIILVALAMRCPTVPVLLAVGDYLSSTFE